MGEIAERRSSEHLQSKGLGELLVMNLNQWLDQMTRKSNEVQKRVHIALKFLQKHYGVPKEDKILSEIRCIDFSHSVSTPPLPAKTMLVGSKDPRVSPYRATYFTKSGHPVQRLGVATSGNISRHGNVLDATVRDKVVLRYEVLVPIPQGEVLQSICAPARDHWSIHGQKALVEGGGLQYLIPNMDRYLRHIAE